MRAVAVLLLVMCHLAVSHAWKCRAAPQLPTIMQIDAGQGKVVARDASYSVYMLCGTTWFKLGSPRLKHVTVGPGGIWGADTSNRVYKYVNGQFQVAGGLYMQQVDAGGDGQIVGATYNYYGYCLRSYLAAAFTGAGSLSWSYSSIRLRYYSCGPLYGCWAIDTSFRIWFTKKMVPTSCGISRWTHIGGSAKMVEVGTDGTVFVVNRGGNVFQRTGITSGRPQGTRWTHIKMCLPIHHLSYDQRRLWVVTKGGIVMQCTH
ncbi:Fish-egg lectin [Larimichthys crocea]|uniref:Fish-egg lectin n=1 Tax=Larimichthys crocea TaxID=215358 RepID=A0A6G0HRD9_LARCR|nr:Fish-egg lectin [Larimichthys crocea]